MTVKPDPPPQVEVGRNGLGAAAASSLFQLFATQALPDGPPFPELFGIFEYQWSISTSRRGVRDARRLTSTDPPRVMATNKNQETQCTFFQGGFDADA
jgi:hypothetical protein